MRRTSTAILPDRFFRDISDHQAFVQQQQQQVVYQEQPQDAGYQTVKRERGKGAPNCAKTADVAATTLVRGGKKHKNCHGRPGMATTLPAATARPPKGGKKPEEEGPAVGSASPHADHRHREKLPAASSLANRACGRGAPAGIAGTAQAMRAMEYLQLDPLQIIARSQDINPTAGARLHARPVGEGTTMGAGSSTGAAGWPSGRWTNCPALARGHAPRA